MKKILALLFVCIFSQTIFASRVLIIRNDSGAPKSFYALEMIIYDFSEDYNRCIHAAMMNPVTLEPGKQIMFAQYNHGDVDSFNFCPTPSIPNKDYKAYLYKDVSQVMTSFEWDKYKYSSIPNNCFLEGTLKCQDVPQHPFNERIIFRGFKTCSTIDGTIGGYPNSLEIVYVNGNFHQIPSNIEYDTISTRAMFYELVRFI